MRRAYIYFTIQALILLLVQATVMNHVRLFGYFTPILYLYPLFKLPIQTPRWVSVMLGGLLGFGLDILMNTIGLNLAVGALIGVIRTPLLHSTIDEEMLEEESSIIVPSFGTLSVGKYMLYLLVLTIVQISSLMLLEAFSVNIYAHVLPNIIGSSIVSYILFLIFDVFFTNKKR